MAHGIGHLLVRHYGLGRPSKAREFVDHAPDIVDLAHDRVSALRKNAVILADRLAVFAAQPLGRQLDGGERVLDLVCDAARDVGPGRGTLGRDQRGDIVERQHVAVFRLARLFAGDADRQIALATVAGDGDLVLRAGAGLCRRHHVGELGNHLVQGTAERFGFRAVDQLFR